MLAAVLMLVLAVPAARGAEIPPTPECSAILKKAMKRYYRENPRPGEVDREGDRKLSYTLADAGCVSDVEPLLKKLPSKAFSEECADASGATGEFLAPIASGLADLEEAMEKRIAPLERRRKQVNQKYRRLKQSGASPKRLRPLQRAKIRLLVKTGRIYMMSSRDSMKLVKPEAFGVALTFYELISLRCIRWQFNPLKPGESLAPAEKVVKNNFGLIILAFVSTTLQSGGDAFGIGTSSSVSNAATPPDMIGSGRLPMLG